MYEEHTVRAFVRFLGKLDAIWHFDDDAHDCLGHMFDSHTCDLLNEFASEIYANGVDEIAFDEAIQC